jgi:hypothetical protein
MPAAHNIDQTPSILCSRTVREQMYSALRGHPDRETVQTDIQQLCQLATAVLNEHVNDRGRCAACPGVAFPCELAVLAEHNMALL